MDKSNQQLDIGFSEHTRTLFENNQVHAYF